MNTAKPSRVLVLHGDPVTAVGLSALFSSLPDMRMVETERGADVLRQGSTAAFRVDIVVADYESGVDFAKRQRRLADDWPGMPSAKVLVLTHRSLEWDARLAMTAGVHGYILHGCSLDEIVLGVRGSRYVCELVAARIADSLTRDTLTAREMRVLEPLTLGYCNKTIANELAIAVGTVKSHLRSVLEKLDVESRTQAVVVASQRGLVVTTHASNGHTAREELLVGAVAAIPPLLAPNETSLFHQAA